MRTTGALWIVTIALAIALIPSIPYGYYSVMRWLVCASCAWLSLASFRSEREEWAWCWGVIAGIYNPIFPVHATREIWSFVNVAAIVLAAWYTFKASRPNRGKQDGGEA
ncbi:DUF6804 family protein [Rhodanobacter soli]|jgi:hypothetical protein|uniref:DUF6804 family protein n=1 Tax=Rhodanobacter soli TaxID=590609 RepID=UPI003397B8C2